MLTEGKLIGTGDSKHVLSQHASLSIANEDASGIRTASLCEPDWGCGCVAYAESFGISGIYILFGRLLVL
jgi:hypothetical protein